jgi:hypothetical protein
MSVSAALEVAWASNPKGETDIETLQFDHVSFDEPARIICRGLSADTELSPALGDDPVSFKWCPTEVTPPGITKDGATPMQIRVQNITKVLLPYLRLTAQTDKPIEVTYRVYLPSDLTQPQSVLTGFRLRVADFDAFAMTGTVGLHEIETQNVPLRTFDAINYPTLQNS